MTQLASVRTTPSAESRLIAGVCAAHMMSHYYLLMLAPLFAFIRADFNVSYTELALALTVFNVVSGLLQTPVGFLVDRIGARVVLIIGLALSSAAYAIAGLFGSYWMFIAMYGVAGLGNTTYHPADYSLLSHHSPPERLSQIFAFHTFAGMLGSAIAPVTLLTMQSFFGWRGAYVGAAIFGFVVLAVLIAQPEPISRHSRGPRSGKTAAPAARVGWRYLTAPAILLNLAFFTLTALMGNGLNTYSYRRAWRAARHAARGCQYRAHEPAYAERRWRFGRWRSGQPRSPACAHRSLRADHRRRDDSADRIVESSFSHTYCCDGNKRFRRWHDLSVARHAGARGYSAGRFRSGVRLCLNRL